MATPCLELFLAMITVKNPLLFEGAARGKRVDWNSRQKVGDDGELKFQQYESREKLNQAIIHECTYSYGVSTMYQALYMLPEGSSEKTIGDL